VRLHRLLIALLPCVILLGAVYSTEAGAQALGKINNFNIVIENLPPGASSCGVTEETLEDSLRFILQQSRIKVVKQVGRNWLYLNVNVIYLPEVRHCVYAVQLQVNTQAVILANNQSASVVISEKGGSGIAEQNQAAKKINEMVETLAKSLVAAWSKDNSE